MLIIVNIYYSYIIHWTRISMYIRYWTLNQYYYYYVYTVLYSHYTYNNNVRFWTMTISEYKDKMLQHGFKTISDINEPYCKNILYVKCLICSCYLWVIFIKFILNIVKHSLNITVIYLTFTLNIMFIVSEIYN